VESRHPIVIFEDPLVIVQQADFCAIPGYLVVRFKNGAQSMADLTPDEAAQTGILLSACISALEQVANADRVYTLVLAEMDRNLHFHLFPRSAGLLEAYHQATSSAHEPVNGSLLFEWARSTYPANVEMPAGYPPLADACRRISNAITAQLTAHSRAK